MGQRSLDVDVGFVDRFEELHRVAYRAAFAVLGRRADAQDCAQEALARALVRWRTVAPYASAWVARVSTNLAIDRARRDAKVRVGGEPASSDPMSDRRRDLVVALRALPKRQREAVALRYLADLPEAEAASAMGCSVGTIKSATSRGLAALRTQLGPDVGVGGLTMFDDLNDPNPPTPGLDDLATVSQRAQSIRRRRTLVGLGGVALVALVAGIVLIPRLGGDAQRIVTVDTVDTVDTVETVETSSIPSSSVAPTTPTSTDHSRRRRPP